MQRIRIVIFVYSFLLLLVKYHTAPCIHAGFVMTLYQLKIIRVCSTCTLRNVARVLLYTVGLTLFTT